MSGNVTPTKRTPLALLQPYALTDKSSIKSQGSNFLTPHDVRELRRKRAREFNLTPPPVDTFLLNQSLPCMNKDSKDGPEMGATLKCNVEKLRIDSLDSISFSPLKVPYLQDLEAHCGRHLKANCFHVEPEPSAGNTSLQSYVQNPNKAILTIDAQTTEILTANKVATFILGLDESSVSLKLSDFIQCPEEFYTFSEVDLKNDGKLVLVSGKVVDLLTSSRRIIPVSLWAKQLSCDSETRCLVIMEPVERTTAHIEFDSTGKILECDYNFATLYGYLNLDEVIGLNVKDLIPSIEFGAENNHGDLVPKEGLTQSATGKTKDGFNFSLSITIKAFDKKSRKDRGDCAGSRSLSYEGIIWVFNNISGLITLLPDGTIHSCNTNFSMILFGYTQNELVGQNISVLVPTFFEDTEFLDTESVALPLYDDDEDSNARYPSTDGRRTADSNAPDFPPRPTNPTAKPLDLSTDDSEPSHDYLLSSSLSHSFPHLAPIFPLQQSESSKPSLQPIMDSDEGSSSKLCCNSEESPEGSKPLSCSESQDTLHSCATSITESDMNIIIHDDRLIVRDKIDEVVDSYDEDSFVSGSEGEEYESEHGDLYDIASPSADPEPQDIIEAPLLFVTSCEPTSPVSPRVRVALSPCELTLPPMKISTPKEHRYLMDESLDSLPEGGYVGTGRHRDGQLIGIEYHIKKVMLDESKFLYCLWVSRIPDEIKDCSPVCRKNYSPHLDVCSGRSKTESAASSTGSMLSDSAYIAGPFSDSYSVFEHIGKGAFGCIKRAYRLTDRLIVITKFIRKSEIYKDLWVYDNKLNKKVPLEISFLATIEHPNIVRMLDVFENEECFQMVMEKHGDGIDLFEFIEREPNMDEPLASYIFRQIVSALSYLHSLSILHRDIKDENAIINEKFHVKLIDFGSACFMRSDLFSTFCGTTEYCSPEVIMGHKYKGPELEMFALGVTLYTLVFGENPFVGTEEILKGDLVIPRKISDDLCNLICHLLEPEPKERCTLAEAGESSWVNQPVAIWNYSFGEVVNCSENELDPPKYYHFCDEENELEENVTDDEVSCLDKKLAVIELYSKTQSEAFS